jgi:hypothetical protein
MPQEVTNVQVLVLVRREASGEGASWAYYDFNWKGN